MVNAIKNRAGYGDYEVSENSDQPKEANFLKLDISKACTQLKWKPVLNFDETVKFTVEGYQTENDQQPVLSNRIKQIQTYTNMAHQQKIAWAEAGSNSNFDGKHTS